MKTRQRKRFYALFAEYLKLDESQWGMVFQSPEWHEIQSQKLSILDEMSLCFRN